MYIPKTVYSFGYLLYVIFGNDEFISQFLSGSGVVIPKFQDVLQNTVNELSKNKKLPPVPDDQVLEDIMGIFRACTIDRKPIEHIWKLVNDINNSISNSSKRTYLSSGSLQY